MRLSIKPVTFTMQGMNSATRQGVWERKGKMMHFKSLDDVSDGNQYLCITSVNLIDDSLEMKFYSVK